MDFSYIVFLPLVFYLTSFRFASANEGEHSNAGAQVVLTKKALDYISTTAGNILNDKRRKMSFPDLRENIYGGRVEVTKLRRSRFTEGTYSYELMSGNRVLWSLGEASLSLAGDWYVEKKLIFKLTAKGSFEVSVDSMSISMTARFGKAFDGKPTVLETDCSARVNGLRLSFRGKPIVAFLMNALSSTVSDILKPLIEQKLCERLQHFVQGDFNRELKTLIAKAKLQDETGLDMDWSLMSHPTVGSGRFSVYLTGQMYHGSSRIVTPFSPSTLDAAYNDSRMINIFISEYVFNSFLFGALASNQLNFVMVEDDFLKLDCADTLCVGIMVPSFARAFPNTSTSFHFKTLEVQPGRISPIKATGSGKVLFEVKVRHYNGTKESALHTIVDVQFSGNAYFEGNNLVGNLKIEELNIGYVNSTANIIRDELLTLADFLKPLLNSFANDFIKRGAPILLTKGVTLVNPHVQLGERTLQVFSDFTYSSEAD